MENLFKKYLDSSEDYATLQLEIEPLSSFQEVLSTVQKVEKQDNNLLDSCGFKGLYPRDLRVRDFFNLIREIWDIAYSYGETETKRELEDG